MAEANYPVLVAEDNADDAELFRLALRSSGVANPVHIVPDGEDVIRYLQGKEPYADRQAYPFPEILVVDLKMPKVSGFDVLKWLRAHPECRVVPVIIFSTSAIEADVQRAYELGANCYLTKPSDLKSFTALIQLTLRFWAVCTRPELPPRCD
ncbi:MAG: response regulator [Verrucomicrobia subdivision 3 bacterium]|nr:response regulator [Limisphaerales bacterium]